MKTDLQGNVLGSVNGLLGHLGCLEFNAEDGRVYGSLEYKNDGIDGVSFGPAFGMKDDRNYLTVAYGVYGDTTRTDNDYQVLLQYDIASWHDYERTISQEKMHQEGPAEPDGQYFVFTGNTSYGVQNLEYDPQSGLWLMAVYNGKKSCYPNYSLFAADGSSKPAKQTLKGVPYRAEAWVVPLAELGEKDAASGISGWKKAMGSTGLESLGNRHYLVAKSFSTQEGSGAKLRIYRFDPDQKEPFVEVK